MARAAAAAAERSPQEELLDRIFDAVLDNEDVETVAPVEQALADKIDVHEILNEALIAAMDEVGDEFAEGRIFVPEMLMAARAMKAGLNVVRPILTQSGVPSRGKVMLATVQGDVRAFGSHIDTKYAMLLGMIPDCPLDKVSAAGNAAGTGARMAF